MANGFLYGAGLVSGGAVRSLDLVAGSLAGTAGLRGFGGHPASFPLNADVVSPGFDFRDFTLYTTKELLNNYPQHEGIIKQLSKAEY